MLNLAYNSLLLMGLLVASPYLLWRLARGRYRGITAARLGLGSRWLPQPEASGAIWLHALSVGEVGSALPLLEALGRAFPHRPLALSVATGQGLAVAQKALAGREDVRLFVRPLDLPWAIGRLLRHLQPRLFVLVEGDIWPGWQWALARRSVPGLLVNGRVSPRTFAGYRRLGRLLPPLFAGFVRVLVQSPLDKERLVSCGLDPGKVVVGGNLKFDSAPARLGEAQRRKLAAQLGLDGRRVLVAGSTHPGEEEACLKAFAALLPEHSDLALLLAPREVGRGRAVARLAADQGLSAALVSQGRPSPGSQIVILDVLGRLAAAYALGSAAFVGGSLVPVGGHNLLEPAAQGVPVIYGPHTHNFQQMARDLAAAGGGWQVADGPELTNAWGYLLADREKERAMGRAGLDFCRAHRGAVQRAVELAVLLVESAGHA